MCDQDIIVHIVTMHFLSEGVVGLPLDILSAYEPIKAEGIPAAVKAIVLVNIRIKLIIPGSELKAIGQVYLPLYVIAVSTVKPVTVLLYILHLQMHRPRI